MIQKQKSWWLYINNDEIASASIKSFLLVVISKASSSLAVGFAFSSDTMPLFVVHQHQQAVLQIEWDLQIDLSGMAVSPKHLCLL